MDKASENVIYDKLGEIGVIPVVVIDDAKDAVSAAEAILAGGISVMEITFRTDAAAEAIRNVSKGCPQILVGAGTVLTLDQCKAAVEAGAKFIVSPGFDPEVAQWCADNHIPMTPGATTSTEIMTAMRYGYKILKFFPAGALGGVPTMRALTGPFGGVKFIPTGGVNKDNMGEYLKAPFVWAVGGSWLCTKKDIAAGNYEQITVNCREACAIARACRTK
jgi:2-dehydro-3-deoxyphosphogluconate aldolase / (4S)-4-hydroxy-2-oxoglutarate aldolase